MGRTSLFLFSALLHGYAGLRLLPALTDWPALAISFTVALVVGRGAIRRPDRRIGLPADGLHARLPRW